MRCFFLYLLASICFAENLILSSGVNDFFNSDDGSELSSFNADHLELLIQYENTQNEPEFPITEFDTFDVNKKRLVQFEIPNTDSEIIGAVLKLRVLPLSGGIDSEGYGSSDDEISFNAHSLDAQVGVPYYEIGFGINRTPNNFFDFNWDITDPNISESIDTGLEVLIDLGDFNTSYYYMNDVLQRPSFNNNIISDINENQYFSLLVSDDTALDFAELNLTLSSASQNSYVNDTYIPLPVGSPRYYKNNGISYLLFNGNAKIVDCDESLSGDVIIPRYINNFEVNCILSKAFKDCVLIESISLPSNDFFIEDLAFENCTALKYIYFSAGLPSEYNDGFLDTLLIANYADLVLSNIEEKGIESIRSNLQSAFTTWTGNLNQLAPHNDENGIPVFSDVDGNGLEDDMIDYFVDEFLDLSQTNTYSEKLYELAKFGGRVKNFLKRSHAIYGSDYDYAWGNTPQGGGRSLGDLLYDALTGSTDLGAPTSTAANQLFNLDRYINVPKYRAELQNFSNSNLLDDNNYLDLASYTWQNPASYAYADPALANIIQNFQNQGISNPLTEMAPYLIPPDQFTLDETGERLIYDSISNWLIEGINGVDREMLALPFVEIANLSEDNNGIDGFIDVNDEDKIELQKRAIAKKVYAILVRDINDPNSDQEFWDATLRVYDIFKYQLHPTNDYSWMWERYIQPSLLTTLDAIVEDFSYLDPASNILDSNNDGIRDLVYAKYPISDTYRNTSSIYIELNNIIRENYPTANSDGSIRTAAYDNGYLPTEIYDYEIYVDRLGEPIRDSETGLPFFKERILADKFLPVGLKDPAYWRIWYLPESATHQMINPFLFINDTFEIRVNNNYYSVSKYKGIPVSSSSSDLFINNVMDTDLDGVSDYMDEFPYNPNETADSDDDGVGDNADTDDDNDGLLDVVETNTGIWVDINDTGTDPSNSDSDDDGLSDGDEVNVYGSNPLSDDTNGDGESNSIDIDDDNDGIADSYDPFPLVYDVSENVPSSLSGYVEIFFSDYYPSYGVWYGSGENSSINIFYDGGNEFRFEDSYTWDNESLTSTGYNGGGTFRTNFKTKTNDLFFKFTYVSESSELYADDSGKGFFYDGRIDLDKNGMADGEQITNGLPFPAANSIIDLANVYSSAESNLIPIQVLDYASNEKYFPSELKDLRPGSTMVEVSGNQATLQLQMEESSDLQTWEDKGDPATMTIPADTDTKFFRFKMAE
jgi:hypothetical protein